MWVASGSYYPTTALPFARQQDNSYYYAFIMTEYIRMYGGFNGTETLRSQRNWNLNPTILTCNLGDIQCSIIMDAADNVIVDGFIFTDALYNETFETSSEILTPSNSSNSTRRLQSTHSTISIELSSTSGGRGGGVFSNGTNIIVLNSIFYGNLASKGGAIYCIGYTGVNGTYKSPTIINAAFINNYAARGGAIMGDVYCNFECESCLFEDNYASGKGGAIYLDYFCEISVNDSAFIGNVAYESGGCICNDGFSYVLMNNDTLINNEAKWEGGCLYGGSHLSYTGTIFYIEDTNFDNNTALYGFDDIWLWLNDGIVIIEDETESNVTQPATTTIEGFNTTYETTLQETTFNTTLQGTTFNTTLQGTTFNTTLQETTFNTTYASTSAETTSVETTSNTINITIVPITTSQETTTTYEPSISTTMQEPSSEATTIFKKPSILYFFVFSIIFFV